MSRGEMKLNRWSSLSKTLRLALLLFILVISLFPIAWIILSSLKSNSEIFSSPFGFPTHFRLENYTQAIQKTPIAIFYINSLIIAIVSTVLSLIVFSASAYAVARFEFRLKPLLVNLISLSLFVPVTAIILPVYLTIQKLGLYDTKAGLILVHSAMSLPVSFFIFRSYFVNFPIELQQAAEIDGAGFLRTFLSIVIPTSKSAFAAAGVLAFISSWNEFLFALILTTGNNSRTVQLALKYFQSQFGNNYGQLFAACTIVIVPSIVIYLVLREKVETGLIEGAVKG